MFNDFDLNIVKVYDKMNDNNVNVDIGRKF